MAAAAVMLLQSAVPAQALSYTNETLNFEIVYHWGVIWKHAANAQLNIKRSGNGYQATLIGRTRSWADKIYPVRDTLRTTMNANFAPLRYDKITHEKNYFAHDIVTFTHSAKSTTGKGVRKRPNKPDRQISLSSPGVAYDMVSVFYMLRNHNYSSFKPGHKISTVVFSGKSKENLTVTYKGVEKIELRDGTKHFAHRIKFSFTQDDRKKSSDNIDAWLSTDASHKPLLLVGKLPVGEVKCYLGGSLNK